MPVAFPAPAWAGEYVLLGSGFRLHADRHEVDGGTVRIFSAGGIVEMPETAVTGYEQEEIRRSSGHTRSGCAGATAPAVTPAPPDPLWL